MRLISTLLLLLATRLAQFSPAIAAPRPGEALQGKVVIAGTSDAVGFTSFELAFAYPADPTGTWFLVAQSGEAVRDGTLAEWDTTALTDGNYTLRLRVFLDDGTSLDVLVPDLRVRNYTPVETPTPGPTAAARTLTLPAATPPALRPSTPTPLPPNPAVLTSSRLFASLGYGAAAAAVVILLLVLYNRLRRN